MKEASHVQDTHSLLKSGPLGEGAKNRREKGREKRRLIQLSVHDEKE